MKIRLLAQPPQRDRHSYVSVHLSRDHAHVDFSDRDAMLTLGIKKDARTGDRAVRSMARRIVKEVQRMEIERLVLSLDALSPILSGSPDWPHLVQLVTENALLAAYEYKAYKSTQTGAYPGIKEFVLVGCCSADTKRALERGVIIATEMNRARDLANTPGGDMTPVRLARDIRAAAVGTGARVRVLTERDIKALKMGALLGVARGAKERPTFTVVEYWGAKRTDKPIVLVGKGITFDTGGLSLKPADYMLDMHLDMSGGAVVAHAVLAAARLKLPVNAIALIPAAENAVSGESYRPGDVLTSMSGTTIDVLNTDAEGRLILADALTYAGRYTPALIVDVATLTGAALVALGTKCCAVLSKDDELARTLCACGEAAGDYAWPLPLWDEYKPMVEGRFGDTSNVPVKGGRYGGTIGAGMFLAQFVGDYPWAHIDMAPRMTSDEGDHLAQGATGEPMRLLVRLLSEYK